MGPSPHRIRACRLHEVPPGSVRQLDTLPPIALFNVEGDIHAIDDVCTHAFAVLSEGHFDGTSVECPLHMSSFDVRTGEPKCFPATEPVRKHRVEVVDGDVMVYIGCSTDHSDDG